MQYSICVIRIFASCARLSFIQRWWWCQCHAISLWLIYLCIRIITLLIAVYRFWMEMPYNRVQVLAADGLFTNSIFNYSSSLCVMMTETGKGLLIQERLHWIEHHHLSCLFIQAWLHCLHINSRVVWCHGQKKRLWDA